MDMTYQIGLWIVAAVILVVYLRRRRSRLDK